MDKKLITIIIVAVFLAGNAGSDYMHSTACFDRYSLRPSCATKSDSIITEAQTALEAVTVFSVLGWKDLHAPRRILPFREVRKRYEEFLRQAQESKEYPSLVDERNEAIKRTISDVLPRPIIVYQPEANYDFWGCITKTDGDTFIYTDLDEENRITIPGIIKQLKTQLDGIVITKAFNIKKDLFFFEFLYKGRKRKLYYYRGINTADDRQLPQRVKDWFDVYYESNLNTSDDNGFSRRASGYPPRADSECMLHAALLYLRRNGFIVTDHSIRDLVSSYRVMPVEFNFAYFKGKQTAPFKVLVFSWPEAVMCPAKEEQISLVPDIKEFLQALREEGIRCVLFVDTGRHEEEYLDEASQQIESLGLKGLFAGIYDTSLLEKIRGNKVLSGELGPGEIVMVSGSADEASFARELGALFVGITKDRRIPGTGLTIKGYSGAFAKITAKLQASKQSMGHHRGGSRTVTHERGVPSPFHEQRTAVAVSQSA